MSPCCVRVQGGVTAASVLFGGALRSEVKAQGAPASATLEPCFVVHLDIQSDAVHSVADAMAAFTSPEIISGERFLACLLVMIAQHDVPGSMTRSGILM